MLENPQEYLALTKRDNNFQKNSPPPVAGYRVDNKNMIA